MSRPSYLLLVFLSWSLQPAPAFAIITSDAAGTHLVQPGVPAFGRNLDGVVKLYDEYGNAACTGSLIGDHYILTAAHCVDLDENGYVDPGAISAAQFDLQDGVVIVDTLQDPLVMNEWRTSRGSGPDIAVLRLAETAPAGAPRYPLYGGNNDVRRETLLVGYGASGHGSTGYDRNEEVNEKRAGLNRIDSYLNYEELPGFKWLFLDFDSGLPENDALGLEFGFDDLGYGNDEVMGSFGDSGGPMFVGNAIAGVMSTVYYGFDGDVTDDFDSSWGEMLDGVRIASVQDFLVAATNGEARVVPEPSSLVLATLAASVAVAITPRRCRR